MSSLIVETTRISDIRSHNNADTLEIAIVKGWQCVVRKGEFHNGDLVVYFPPDTCLPQSVTDELGVTQYTQDSANGKRIRQTKLRGEPSFGLVIKAQNQSWQEGLDVSEHFGAKKYEPPIKLMSGDSEAENPLLIKYTDIENIRNFPGTINIGEEVVAVEKAHGCNVRIATIEGVQIAGSHRQQKKRPDIIESSFYWFPWCLPGVCMMMAELSKQHRQVILFGETYGRVQSLNYGLGNAIRFGAFDLYTDGKYLDFDEFQNTLGGFGVPMLPIIARDKFTGVQQVTTWAAGKTTIGGDHVREGVVVRPTKERTDPKIGRVILKCINTDYLLSKHSDKDVADV